tara:strand:+ start:19 stop:480 length:462 start_codon:yes stop_codon:yes gene_type:complete
MAQYLKLDPRGPYTSLQKKYNPDGTVDLWVKWVADGVKNTLYLITTGATGYVSKDVFDVAASQTGMYFCGRAKQTQATNTFGWAQVGGYSASNIMGTSTATAGHYVKFDGGKFTTAGNAKSISGTGMAVYTATAASGATHALMLFPDLFDGIS